MNLQPATTQKKEKWEIKRQYLCLGHNVHFNKLIPVVAERRPMVGTYSIPNTLEQTVATNVLIGTEMCQQVSGLLNALPTPLRKSNVIPPLVLTV